MNLATIHPGGGIYILRNGDKVVYVGRSKAVRHRVKNHYIRPFDSVEVLVCEDAQTRSQLEAETILKLSPARNWKCNARTQLRHVEKDLLNLLKKIRTAPTGTLIRYDRKHDRFIRYHARVTREIDTQRDLLDPNKRILVLGDTR
jgi:predicted GIY-YIG superfamily endonuclease